MNKKGQQIVVWIMIGIIIFIATINFINPLNETVITARNSTGLNCSNPDNTTIQTANCQVVDFGFFYIIAIGIAISIALATGRRNITGVFTAIFVFVAVVVMISPLKDFIIQARDANHLNCAATTITTGARMLCIVVDIWLFYFVIGVIASAITYIFLKQFIPKNE